MGSLGELGGLDWKKGDGGREGEAMTISRNRPIFCHFQGTQHRRRMGKWVGAANESHSPSLAEYGPGREAGASGERQKLETLILILATFSCLPALPPVFRVRAEGGMEICKYSTYRP